MYKTQEQEIAAFIMENTMKGASAKEMETAIKRGKERAELGLPMFHESPALVAVVIDPKGQVHRAARKA